MFKFNYIFAFLAVLSTVFLQTAKDIVKPSDGENCSNIGSVLRQKFGIMGRSNNGFKEEKSASGKKVSFCDENTSCFLDQNDDSFQACSDIFKQFFSSTVALQDNVNQAFKDPLNYHSELFKAIFFSSRDQTLHEIFCFELVKSFYEQNAETKDCFSKIFQQFDVEWFEEYFINLDSLLSALKPIFDECLRQAENFVYTNSRDLGPLGVLAVSLNGLEVGVQDQHLVFFYVNRSMFLYLLQNLLIVSKKMKRIKGLPGLK